MTFEIKSEKMSMRLDFTDLILLIGTNPLPNYVAARHFISNPRRFSAFI
jgi:hypothetical protein